MCKRGYKITRGAEGSSNADVRCYHDLTGRRDWQSPEGVKVSWPGYILDTLALFIEWN